MGNKIKENEINYDEFLENIQESKFSQIKNEDIEKYSTGLNEYLINILKSNIHEFNEKGIQILKNDENQIDKNEVNQVCSDLFYYSLIRNSFIDLNVLESTNNSKEPLLSKNFYENLKLNKIVSENPNYNTFSIKCLYDNDNKNIEALCEFDEEYISCPISEFLISSQSNNEEMNFLIFEVNRFESITGKSIFYKDINSEVDINKFKKVCKVASKLVNISFMKSDTKYYKFIFDLLNTLILSNIFIKDYFFVNSIEKIISFFLLKNINFDDSVIISLIKLVETFFLRISINTSLIKQYQIKMRKLFVLYRKFADSLFFVNNQTTKAMLSLSKNILILAKVMENCICRFSVSNCSNKENNNTNFTNTNPFNKEEYINCIKNLFVSNIIN